MDRTKNRIREYIEKWKEQGYPEDIPDEVPAELMGENLAPSYKAIALALLRNDNNMESLGFSPIKSEWYSVFKRIEIDERNRRNGIEPPVKGNSSLFDALTKMPRITPGH